MSTIEARPEPVACGGDDRPDGPVLDLLPGRQVPLSLRATGPQTVVTRLLPQRRRRTVGAWCFVDHYGPDDITGTVGMQVPPHPHTGLQTVSWLLEGAVHHRDSLGSDAVLEPGVLGLMTAGRGIAHSERSPSGPTGPRGSLHGLQLWVALPEEARDGPPAFALHDHDLATLAVDGGSARVFVGSLGDYISPATIHTPLVGAELRVDPGATVTLPLSASYEHALVVAAGGLVVDSTPLEPGALAYLGTGRETMTATSHEGAVAVLLGGEPFTEELVMWWNFIGRSQSEVEEFRRTWNDGTDRYGEVEGDSERLLAPPLPGVPLKPRGRTG